jgi:hypothetical protein
MSDTKEKIIFSISAKQKVDFKIRLHREGITQTMFFSAVISGYNELDEDFMLWYTKARKRINKNKARQKILRKEEDAAINNMKKFGLNKGEIESIYDLIADEKGEQL